jgi:hypothetical protein
MFRAKVKCNTKLTKKWKHTKRMHGKAVRKWAGVRVATSLTIDLLMRDFVVSPRHG